MNKIAKIHRQNLENNKILHFSTKYMSLVRECIPEKTVTIRPKDKPWFDSTLRKTIRKRDCLRNIALKYKRESDWAKYLNIRDQD